MASSKGLKKQIELLLLACKDEPPMTMGDVMARANIPKTNASDVSAALSKLMRDGLVAHSRGASTSSKGPRIVRRYRWVITPQPAKQVPTAGPMRAVARVWAI